MTREDKYLLGCMFAINRLIEKGSSDYAVKVDGKWEMISWLEIREWIEKQYEIEASPTESESEHKRMIDADELLNRIAEKCKTPSLSKDTVNGLCGATAIIYDMLNESEQEKNADKENGNGEIQ